MQEADPAVAERVWSEVRHTGVPTGTADCHPQSVGRHSGEERRVWRPVIAGR
jgi:hypothetical protein